MGLTRGARVEHTSLQGGGGGGGNFSDSDNEHMTTLIHIKYLLVVFALGCVFVSF